MKYFILAVMVLLPHMLFAETDCWYKEYPDQYVAVCTGDTATSLVTPQTTVTTQPAIPADSVAQTQPADTNQPAVKAQAEAKVQADIENAHRPTRMSKERVKAALAVKNKLLLQGE